jgi:hypothetical protein
MSLNYSINTTKIYKVDPCHRLKTKNMTITQEQFMKCIDYRGF